LIAQNVHGSKLVKFEVSGQLQGKQWDNLILTSLNINQKVTEWIDILYLKELSLLFFFFFCGGSYCSSLSHISNSGKMLSKGLVNPSGKIHDIYEWLQIILNLWL
jgi:hypothetical protein